MSADSIDSKYFKIYGMVLGHALGDALGAPCEFPEIQQYTGKLEFPIIRAENKFFKIPRKISAVGQITDDTEMAMCLTRVLYKGFTKDKAALAYMDWANSGVPFLGKNTKKLFQGIKTIKGFNNRYLKHASDSAQGNGPLMRAYPLVIGTKDMLFEDVSLTSPSELCYEMVYLYVKALKLALKGIDKNKIFDKILKKAKKEETILALNQARNNEIRDITGKTKGWIAHSFYCAFYSLLNFNSYKEGIDAVMFLDPHFNKSINKYFGIKTRGETDTDTNACIAGALLGAYYGIMDMCDDPTTKQNLNILIRTNPNDGDIKRPEKFHSFNLLKTSLMICKKYNI